MNNTIFTENFLLENDIAIRLYHQFAKDLPIIDYHNHLPPAEIAENKTFKNITEIWLKGDHYKWRAMRSLGVNEKYITGDADDFSKFEKWAECVPQTLRNPLFHWTHLELKNPFGVSTYLNKNNATGIYEYTTSLLQQNDFSTTGLLNKFKVEMLCTTDDPCDNLEHHQKIANNHLLFKAIPGFRPDKVLQIENSKDYKKYLFKLSSVSGIEITDYESLLEALSNRIDYFHKNGCRISDHGMAAIPTYRQLNKESLSSFKKFLNNEENISLADIELIKSNLLIDLAKCYHQKGWVQQFHIGPLRNNNSKLMKLLGADAGADSIGDELQAKSLSIFLDTLNSTDQLGKTILYNLNPAYNEVYATMAGNFNDGFTKGKIQFGSAWWFLDQLDGMEKQLNTLSNLGILSTFVGMLTDSRSFLSFPRHEYYRRLVCNILGKEIEKGLLPNDEQWIGEIITAICYQNAKNYFNIT